MNHVEFNFYEDFSIPLGAFLDSCGMQTYLYEKNGLVIPSELYLKPKNI